MCDYKKNVLKSIERFKKTGRLPKEEERSHGRAIPFSAAIENIGYAEPYASPDAERLKDGFPLLMKRLSKMQKYVFNFHMLGGMSLTETANILNISPSAISGHINRIRAHARKVIERAKLREDFLYGK